jgi:ribosomal-protein-alanine N-acetyltransferase
MPIAAPLKTERLNLRPALERDWTFLIALASDESVQRFLGGVKPLKQREMNTAQLFVPREEEIVWIAETRSPVREIGLITISPHHDGDWREISYQFHPDFWGRGFATEALMAIMEFAFNYLSDQILVAETQSANLDSRRLLQRLGMSELGRLSRFGSDQIIYSIRR